MNRRGLYDVKTIVAKYPSIALPIARRRHGFPVDRETDIVIEGFPRSGNTFAYTAFLMAQSRPVRAAGRVHAPAQLIAAARWGIPGIVLIRHPDEAIPSFLIRHPRTGVRQAIRGWLRFYAPLRPYLNRFVVATFDQATRNLGQVIETVNDRFGTDFTPFRHTEENVRKVWEAIDRDYRTRVGEGAEFDRIVARPSPRREEQRRQVRELYSASDLEGDRARLRKVWERFASAAT
ncbi:MAG TPA: hypothetical protein VHI54_06455 [Actinomycetota bacterium]|nr:hypothetical protein [Actinomycetota bacterium]